MNHVLHVDRRVIETQVGLALSGTAIHVSYVRCVAGDTDLDVIGAIVAVHRQLVVAVVAFLYGYRIASWHRFGIGDWCISDRIRHRDSLQRAFDIDSRMAVDGDRERTASRGRHRNRRRYAENAAANGGW